MKRKLDSCRRHHGASLDIGFDIVIIAGAMFRQACEMPYRIYASNRLLFVAVVYSVIGQAILN